MELQVCNNIKEIQECNRIIVRRLNALNKREQSPCHQCQSIIERLAKAVTDLASRMEKLYSYKDNKKKQECEIERRYQVIQSQLDDMCKDLAMYTSGSNPNATGLVRQTKKYYLSCNEEIWKALAQSTLERALPRTDHLRCVVTVLCLDTSESMSAGYAWREAKMFVNDFLAGLDELKSNDGRILDEYVALVTFGHETKLQQVLTNNYDDIRDQLEHLALGGPSPLYGGLTMGHAGAICANKNAPSYHGLILTPKLIVITDGRPTDTMLHAGPDIEEKNKMEQTLSHVATAVTEIDRENNHILFIGVGDYNTSLIESMSAIIGSKIYTFKDGRRLSRHGIFESLLTAQGFALKFTLNTSLSAEDKEDIKYYRADTRRRTEKHFGTLFQDSKDENLLALGTRVRIGPCSKRQTFDLNGPGTVIGHFDGKCLVTWDLNDLTSCYQYDNDVPEVQAVNEPRILISGELMAPGCRVKPGRDNKSYDLDSSILGVVLRVYGPLALVMWDNGKRDKCSYGMDGKREIELA